MRKFGAIWLVLLGLLLAPLSALYAATASVTPKNGSVGVGQTLQFTAQITGLSSSDVTWYAGGVKGGNSTAGTISDTGLYTAPATLPGQNPVSIKAVSKADATVSASTYVNILALGPTITSVSPNPLPVGTQTVTIQGTGFQAGATIYQSYGTTQMIQYGATTITPTTVTTSVYQPAAPSATFCVRNPGTTYSNSITVPVGSGDNKGTYSLSVVNGSGSGTYTPGTTVTITANPAPAGQTFVKWTGATVQNATATTTTLTMPSANVTVTANYSGSTTPTYGLTVQNGSGSGTYAAGTVVSIKANNAPAGQVFQNWTGAVVQDPNAASTTLTMPAAATTVTANYTSVAVNIPFPVTTHPRLWITQNDLPRLRGWASTSNPIYQQGVVPVLNSAVNIYNTQFFPGGQPNPNYPDPGDVQGYQGYLTEQYGLIFAFNSLIDPSPTKRIQYAQYARNVLMYAMNIAVQGHQANMPFRDPMFAVYNRANGSGEQWPLIVDWIYNAVDAQGNPILTATDKQTIRNVFLIWANDCINAYTTGGDHPYPMGVTNSLQLLPNGGAYRMAANNYYLGHARLLTMMALSMDPSDDAPINAGAPASQLGNTLRSYILNANGAWLYQEFAMFGDPSTVASSYGIGGTGAGLGLASGGLPPEGMLYGHSFAYVLGQLLALQTAGFNSVNYTGPQAQLIGAPVWDRFVVGFISSMTPTSKIDPAQPWLGPIYQYASYGDLLRLWVTPDYMQPFALLALLNQQNGLNKNVDTARWFAVNAVEGGPTALMNRITRPWSFTETILYFMLMDPAAAPGADPRPTYSTTFYDAPAGRLVAHSDWSANGTMFDYRGSWISINHQDGDGGQFELYRNGEWLTKEMSNYDNNAQGLTTKYHNTLALQNWCAAGTPNLNWYEGGEWANGSQWMLGLSAGDPLTTSSSGPGYAYTNSDLTKLYNRPNIWTPSQAAMDIQQATRSVVWLNNDYIVVYDRATSVHSGLFKRFNLCTQTAPVINGNLATETLPSGQQLFVQTLLPANPSITAAYSAGNLSPIAWGEPMQYILTVEDPSKPSDTRFLHVLQGADKGTSVVPATRLQSTSGTLCDGAVFGSSAVFFPVNAGGQPRTTTFTLPGNVHTLLVTGLAPNASYSVSTQMGASTVVTVTPGGGSATTDGAGVLPLTF